MDQKSFSVLLNFSQSSPVDGGLISGVVRSAARPIVANVSSTSPRTSFFIERPPSALETLIAEKSVGFYICKRDCATRCATMPHVRGQQCNRCRRWAGRSRGRVVSGSRGADRQG